MSLPLGVLPAIGEASNAASNVQGAISNIGKAASGVFGGGSQSFATPVNITLKLGDFVFQGMEVPEVIPFHASQVLSKKRMIGGVRQFDATGTDYAPITWSGMIWPAPGMSALDRAKQLALMRDKGLPLTLSWDTLRYSVLIADFSPDYRFARIPYTITMEVIEDLTKPAKAIVNPTIDDLAVASVDTMSQVLGFIAKIENLSAALVSGYAAISEAVGSVQSAIYAASSVASSASSASPVVPSSPSTSSATTAGTQEGSGTSSGSSTPSTLVSAPPSVVNPIMQTVVFAINTTASVSAQADAVLSGAAGIAGVSVGQFGAVNIAAFNAVLAANQMQVQLLQLSATLKVLLSNLQSINSSLRIITVSGGNLYQVAAVEYGDSTAADLIMEANGLLDPQLSGNVTLIIPPYSAAAANGGILSV